MDCCSAAAARKASALSGDCCVRLTASAWRLRQVGQPLLGGLEGLGARAAGLRAQDAAELLERGEHLLLGLTAAP